MTDSTTTTTASPAPPAAPLPVMPAPAAARASPGEGYELVLQPRRGWAAIDWGELFHYRELLYFLVWRDVKVRYKQTVLGVAWAVLQPLFSMVVFTIIFGNLAGMKHQLDPALQDRYALFVYAGLLPWMLFSNAILQGGQSLVAQQYLLTKIYLPRLFIPSAAAGGALFDMAMSFGVFALLMVYYQAPVSWGVAALPLLLGLTLVAALGVSYVLAALTVSYRDFRFVIPFMVQAWMYVSPVVYPVRIVPEQWQWVLALNPMAGIIDGYRSALLGQPWRVGNLLISGAAAAAVFIFSLYYFRRMERRFADVA